MAILDSLVGAAGTAVLQRTYMLQASGSSLAGIPQPLAVFDAILEEDAEYSNLVTEHPVEAGPEVTDHIQPKNPSLRLKGVMSNSPLDLSVSIGNLVAGGISAVTSSQLRTNLLNTGLQQAAGTVGAKLLGGASGGFLGGAADAIARSILISACEKGQLVDIVTKRQKYPSMAITNLRFPRDQETGYALAFEIDLIHVRIVSPLTTLISQVSEDAITSASGKTNLGSQATGSVTDAVQKAVGNNSILRGLKTSLFGG